MDRRFAARLASKSLPTYQMTPRLRSVPRRPVCVGESERHQCPGRILSVAAKKVDLNMAERVGGVIQDCGKNGENKKTRH